MADDAKGWDASYQWKAVALLGVGFGLVGLDRWIIAPLLPFTAADLGLPAGEIGRLAGILGVLWGVFAIFSGRLSDRIGHREVLNRRSFCLRCCRASPAPCTGSWD